MSQTASIALIGPADPAPVELLCSDSPSDVLLLCEHAGRAIPSALGTLGVQDAVLSSHRGWDIGAEMVARRLSDILAAPLILQRYSRLVIDCNRPPGSTMSIPEISDHAAIPGNRAITPADRTARETEIFRPLDRAVTDLLDRQPRQAVFSIHSFTPRMDGIDRPWHAGFLTRHSQGTGTALMNTINRLHPDLNLALNQPYQIDAETDWFIPRHAETRNLPHCLIEVRNDLIDDEAGAAFWADLLGQAIHEFMEGLS